MSFHGKNSNNPQKSIFITNVFFGEKKALLADNAGTFHAFKSLFGFGHVFSFVAVNCFTFWNLVWICEGFWQIFALECALCCCMLIVIGQWTLTLACLAYPGYFGSDPHKGFILQMAHFMSSQKNLLFFCYLCPVLFWAATRECWLYANGWSLARGATLCWNCVSNHLPRCQPQNKRQPW